MKKNSANSPIKMAERPKTLSFGSPVIPNLIRDPSLSVPPHEGFGFVGMLPLLVSFYHG